MYLFPHQQTIRHLPVYRIKMLCKTQMRIGIQQQFLTKNEKYKQALTVYAVEVTCSLHVVQQLQLRVKVGFASPYWLKSHTAIMSPDISQIIIANALTDNQMSSDFRNTHSLQPTRSSMMKAITYWQHCLHRSS